MGSAGDAEGLQWFKGFLGHFSNYEPLDFDFSFWLPLQDARAAELVRLYEKGFAIFLKVSGCI